MQKCAGCRFYDRNERASAEGGHLRWGRCRHSVPSLHTIPGRGFNTEGVWPLVRDDDWCGAWEARDEAPRPASPLHPGSLLAAPSSQAAESALKAPPSGPRESLLVPIDSTLASSRPASPFASD